MVLIQDFLHLHVHSHYSVLDGCAKIDDLFITAKELGQPALAITDHGSTSGLYDAQKTGEKYGIKAILGTEFYYVRENDKQNGHLIVLAKDNEGIENIFKLQEYAYVHNFYYKPRIKWEMLKQHNKGLIVTSACLGSTFAQYLIEGNTSDAKDWAKKFQEVFGEDFYIEIQPLNIPEQHEVNKASIKLAKELGIEVIATNDVHYVHESDYFTHEILLAMQTNKKISDEKRFKFPTNDFWLKSRDEMINTFHGIDEGDVITALNNTVKIADKCNASIEQGKYLPKYYDIPKGKTERELLVEQTIQGIKDRNIKNKKYLDDVQYEIDVIDRNGYSGYFLIVADYVNSAREKDIIVGDGRGSGAGSKVANLTGITKIEPEKHDLLFERFMADGRSPDFDVDFSDQEAIFKDLQRKYGVENVAHIVAFGTMTPKAVCRKVLSTFEHPTPIINKISKLIPNLCPSLEEAYEESPELLDYKNKYKVEFEVIEKLEGVISHESQHAGGIIIYPNLSSVLPVKTKGEDRTKRIVGFDKKMLEEIGHYKFDVLGLETLPVIKRTLDSIRESTLEQIDLYNIDYDDENVYNMLCSGDVSGVFQLAGQAQKVMEQKPRNFKDLIAINALIRPGVGDWEKYIARRKGKEWSIHPDRMAYLEETEGVLTYQEQFLLDCKTFAGWDIAFADKNVRKNKDIKNDEDLKHLFIEDCLYQRKLQEKQAEELWDEICDVVDGGYGFNKSHSASYAIISYQTAWLKYYYPEHFYASLMTKSGDDQDLVANYIAECKQRDIKILPPDINLSDEEFIVARGGINYRITTIKHVGDSAIQHIKELRPIKSFDDFLERREKQHIKKNVMINLIKSGCFDFDNPNRAELLWKFDMSERTKTQIKEDYQCPEYEYNDKIKAEWEKEVLGMYLSLHPMEKYGFKQLDAYPDGGDALQGGEVYDVKEIIDKNNNQMAFGFLSTLYGNLKVVIFSNSWNEETQEAFQVGNIVLTKGRRSGSDILLNEVEVLE